MSKWCMGCMEQYNDEFNICPHCGYIDGSAAEESVHMEPGSKLVDRYIVGKVLGYGSFGVTYIAWDEKLEQKVAIKEYLPSEFSTRMPGEAAVTVFSGDRNEQFHSGLEKFTEEAKRLSKFQNEAGIVKVFDSFKENNTAYIIMEYLDGETLSSYLEREGAVPEDKAIEMLKPVMISLQTVHEQGILHRDIAPDNIFLTKNGEVKLIDFGASRYATTSHSRSLTVLIKLGYSPEEQYRSRGDQGPHTDVYALAATMYKMITGITPPDAIERHAMVEDKKKEPLIAPHKINKHISLNRENAILNAMNIRIEDRTPDIKAFMEELNADPPVNRRYGKIKKMDLYSWPLWLKITMSAVLVSLLVIGALLLSGIIEFPSLFSDKVEVPEGMVIVPDVEGMDKDAALEEISKLGLMPFPDGNVDSGYVEAGKIVLQTPIGGSYLELNGAVILTVSSGHGVVEVQNGVSTVPYVIWDTRENAIAKLMQAGLANPIIKTRSDENVAEGKVISQSIEAGTEVKEDTRITIVVSTGPAPTETSAVVSTGAASSETSAVISTGSDSSETPATVTVILNANGGSISKNRLAVYPSSTYGELPTPTHESYTFAGWFTAAVGGTRVESETEVSIFSTHMLYAHWTQNGYSDWVESLPAGVTNADYEIETRMEYQSRDRLKTTSESDSMSGWTQYDKQITSWGDWSSWSSDVSTASSSRQVETQNIAATYKTVWVYDRWVRLPDRQFAYNVGDYGGEYQRIELDYRLSFRKYVPGIYGGQFAVYQSYVYGGNTYLRNVWYNERQETKELTPARTEYRYRDAIYTYYYEKWTDWSDWSVDTVSSTDDRQVQTRTAYRYRKK